MNARSISKENSLRDSHGFATLCKNRHRDKRKEWVIPTQTQGPKEGMGLRLDLDTLAHEQPLLRKNQTWEMCADFPTTILRAHQI